MDRGLSPRCPVPRGIGVDGRVPNPFIGRFPWVQTPSKGERVRFVVGWSEKRSSEIRRHGRVKAGSDEGEMDTLSGMSSAFPRRSMDRGEGSVRKRCFRGWIDLPPSYVRGDRRGAGSVRTTVGRSLFLPSGSTTHGDRWECRIPSDPFHTKKGSDFPDIRPHPDSRNSASSSPPPVSLPEGGPPTIAIRDGPPPNAAGCLCVFAQCTPWVFLDGLELPGG